MKKIDIDHKTRSELALIVSRHKTYARFSACKKDAYRFVQLIGITVCPYCNINYIYAVFDKRGQGVARPDLDHFLSKADNPSAALDWKNLIPSCQQCNSRLKLKKAFSASTHIHPYKADFDAIMRIGVTLTAANYLAGDSFEIAFFPRDTNTTTANTNAHRNIRDFRLTERYAHHKSTVIDIFKKLQFYHRSRRQEILDLLGWKGELLSLLLADRDCDINNTSLGKLKRDIIDHYGCGKNTVACRH